MAAVNQGGAIAEPDDQLGSNPVAHSRQHRPGYGVHVRQEASQLHLAGMPCPIPAGKLWLDTLPHNAYRAAVHHCHVVIVVRARIWWQPADTSSKLRARSGKCGRSP
jgi:hypothetical protein